MGGIQTPALHVRVPGLSERSAWSLTLSLDYALATSVHATHATIKRVSIAHFIPAKNFEFSKLICSKNRLHVLATATPRCKPYGTL